MTTVPGAWELLFFAPVHRLAVWLYTRSDYPQSGQGLKPFFETKSRYIGTGSTHSGAALASAWMVQNVRARLYSDAPPWFLYFFLR